MRMPSHRVVLRWYTQRVPTHHPRIQVTEDRELAAALQTAASHLPAGLPRSQQVRELAIAGARHLAAAPPDQSKRQALLEELAETQAALPADASLEIRARALADQWMERFARDRESVVLHMEFIAHGDRDPELARRFGTRSAAMREALSGYISQYQEEAGVELALPADDLALVLRALGIGLAVESLVSPEAVRDDLYGDFVELLVRLLRDGGSAEPPSRHRRSEKAKR